MLTRAQGLVFGTAIIAQITIAGPALAQTAATMGPAIEASHLVAAYPDHLASIEGNALVWKDGTRMPIDDKRGAKPFEIMLAAADIKDMFLIPYSPGAMSAPPAVDVDPGRARNAAFFDKMYGKCQSGAVSRNLVDVVWLPKKWGRKLRVTRINGVAEKLAAVSKELDELPAKFDVFLFPSAGTYNCRPIAGTTRTSAHGHGIAIDLSTQQTDYWLWTTKGKLGAAIPYRNKIPMEIVSIFEKHGFIWGGKWYHYDTMHFEYRPELLAGAR